MKKRTDDLLPVLAQSHNSYIVLWTGKEQIMEQNIKSTTVKSVFKSGENTTTEREFTDKWIELINTLERNKSVNLCENG